MRTRLFTVVLAASVVSSPSLSAAQSLAPPSGTIPAHTADAGRLDRLLTGEVAKRDHDRAAIRQLLQREDVRRIARESGLDIRKAEAAVATLDGKELQDVARRARDVQEQLAGGSSITITTTTLIIVLLLVILLIVALK